MPLRCNGCEKNRRQCKLPHRRKTADAAPNDCDERPGASLDSIGRVGFVVVVVEQLLGLLSDCVEHLAVERKQHVDVGLRVGVPELHVGGGGAAGRQRFVLRQLLDRRGDGRLKAVEERLDGVHAHVDAVGDVDGVAVAHTEVDGVVLLHLVCAVPQPPHNGGAHRERRQDGRLCEADAGEQIDDRTLFVVVQRQVHDWRAVVLHLDRLGAAEQRLGDGEAGVSGGPVDQQAEVADAGHGRAVVDEPADVVSHELEALVCARIARRALDVELVRSLGLPELGLHLAALQDGAEQAVREDVDERDICVGCVNSAADAATGSEAARAGAATFGGAWAATADVVDGAVAAVDDVDGAVDVVDGAVATAGGKVAAVDAVDGAVVAVDSTVAAVSVVASVVDAADHACGVAADATCGRNGAHAACAAGGDSDAVGSLEDVAVVVVVARVAKAVTPAAVVSVVACRGRLLLYFLARRGRDRDDDALAVRRVTVFHRALVATECVGVAVNRVAHVTCHLATLLASSLVLNHVCSGATEIARLEVASRRLATSAMLLPLVLTKTFAAEQDVPALHAVHFWFGFFFGAETGALRFFDSLSRMSSLLLPKSCSHVSSRVIKRADCLLDFLRFVGVVEVTHNIGVLLGKRGLRVRRRH